MGRGGLWLDTLPRRGHQLPLGWALMWTTIFAIAMLYVGSTIPTPLYPSYERLFGFSELRVTEIYAVYVLGNLLVLFFFGRLSDQIGRRATALAAFGMTVLSASCFLFAMGSGWLFVARGLNGFAAGLGAATLTAWIAELEPGRDRARAAIHASSGNLAGLAAGALVAGFLVSHAPFPLRTSWALYLAFLAITIVLLRRVPETVEHRVRTLGDLSLRPRIGVPSGLRLAFVAPAAMAFASFALGGFYAALAPGLLVRMGQTSAMTVGLIVALFFGSASLAAAGAPRVKTSSILVAAVALLLLGLALLLLAEGRHAVALLLAAALVAGPAVALGYRGSLQSINEMAPSDRRAELVSSYLLVCYVANSLPVVGAGLLSQAVGPAVAHRVFASFLAACGLIAAVVGWKPRFAAAH